MSDNHGRYSGAHLMLAFLAGAAGGACAALLSAPEPGAETRERVKGWANQTQRHAERASGSVRAACRRATTAARQAFEAALQEDASDLEDHGDDAEELAEEEATERVS